MTKRINNRQTFFFAIYRFFVIVVVFVAFVAFVEFILQNFMSRYGSLANFFEILPLSLLTISLTISLIILLTMKSFMSFLSKSTIWQKNKIIWQKNKIHIFLYIVFVLLLSAIFFAIVIWIILAGPNKLSPSDVISRISLILPLIWLTSHVNGVINKRAKLSVEYEHKEKIMNFYIAFKVQVADDPELNLALSKGVADVILRFPSIIGEAEETDSPLDKILNKIRGKGTKSSIDDNVIRRVVNEVVD